MGKSQFMAAHFNLEIKVPFDDVLTTTNMDFNVLVLGYYGTAIKTHMQTQC